MCLYFDLKSDEYFLEVNVSTLKNVAFVKSSLVPTLNNIIPYLEVSSNQEYLVNRIKGVC